jgi:hypothetical protein
MQVGLATKSLADNDAFQSASYGFTVFSILGPLPAACFIFLGVLLRYRVHSPVYLHLKYDARIVFNSNA